MEQYVGEFTVTYTQVALWISAIGTVFLPIVALIFKRFKNIDKKHNELEVLLREKITRAEASQLIVTSINGLERSVDQLHQDIRMLLSKGIQHHD